MVSGFLPRLSPAPRLHRIMAEVGITKTDLRAKTGDDAAQPSSVQPVGLGMFCEWGIVSERCKYNVG
jgi:hypothetical protein